MLRMTKTAMKLLHVKPDVQVGFTPLDHGGELWIDSEHRTGARFYQITPHRPASVCLDFPGSRGAIRANH